MKWCLLLLATCLNTALCAQDTVTFRDSIGVKIVKGPARWVDWKQDTAMRWVASSYAAYKPNETAVQALKSKGSEYRFVVFGGTWCEDTHFLLPKFFAWLDASGFDLNKVQLYGVDRSKQSTGSLSKDWKINLVPTFILLKGDTEVYRMVEYGKYAQPDKELSEQLK